MLDLPDEIDVDALVDSTLTLLGARELLSTVRVVWRDFDRRLGDARVVLSPSGGYIGQLRFSKQAWPLLTFEEQREVVIHEVCHLVDIGLAWASNKRPGPPHGDDWRWLMRVAGYPNAAARHHRAVLPNTRRRFAANCECRTHMLTSIRAARIKRGRKYVCLKCRKNLTLSDGVKDETNAAA